MEKTQGGRRCSTDEGGTPQSQALMELALRDEWGPVGNRGPGASIRPPYSSPKGRPITAQSEGAKPRASQGERSEP